MEQMPWRELYFSLQGRIRRSDFWWRWMIPAFVILFLAGVADAVLEMDGMLVVVVNLILFYPALAVSVKRCHDRGRSGWFILVILIPVVGLIWYYVEVGFLRGTVGDNRFGPDPLGDETAVGPSLSA